jgi:2-oxo-4-hydroxy-4-carboxy-5-ureidoimidazoline decarboxylase
MMSAHKIPQLNAAAPEDFTKILAHIYEHSPWIPAAVAHQRPFKDLAALHETMVQTVSKSPIETQLDLIQSHPDLAGRLAQQGRLTPESTREQAAAGLAQADGQLIAQIQTLNADYRARFGFPFIICARLNRAEAILEAMQNRLANERAEEIAAALGEIYKIARLRLEDIIED